MEAARAAVPADVMTIAALARAAIDELAPTKGGEVWRRREARAEPLEASIAASLDDPAQHVVAGLVDDVIVGYGVVRVEQLRDGGALAVIDDLYVDHGAREVGVGEALMAALVEWSEARGCFGIDALALPGNRATKNFFESFGLVARAIVVHRTLGDR